MSQDNVEQAPPLTMDDLADCGWESALASASDDNYVSMFIAFSTAAQQAEREGRDAHGRVLRLVSFACSMHLDPLSRNQPFKPISVGLDGKPAVIPDDFTEAHIAFFAQIVDAIGNPWLKARLADLVWMSQHPRDVRFPLAAIDAYMAISAEPKPWSLHATDCLKRAINLSRTLGSAAASHLALMQTEIEEAIQSGTIDDEFYVLRLADVLATSDVSPDRCAQVATKLESLARLFEAQGSLHHAREYATTSARWFRNCGDNDKSVEMTVAQAESWAKEGDARALSAEPSHLVAADCYANAIKIYQTIPGSDRDSHQVDQRIAELRRLLTTSHEKAQDEIKSFSTGDIDLTDVAQAARTSVRNKTSGEALRAFGGLTSVSVSQLWELAIDSLTESQIRAFIPMTVLDHDNRVIAKRPAMSGSVPSEDDECVISFEMAQQYHYMVNTAVYGCILPAHDLLTSEHPLRQSDFIKLALRSPIIPPQREILFGKGLYHGYDGDPATALHLLVPQIENMVRFHLKRAGAKTTTLDPKGIETENGLSALIDVPEATTIFGEDITYEIRALFCDHFGPNLRNNVAHGLFDDNQSRSAHAVYAWWFALKLAFNAYWRTLPSHAQDEEQVQAPDDDGVQSRE